MTSRHKHTSLCYHSDIESAEHNANVFLDLTDWEFKPALTWEDLFRVSRPMRYDSGICHASFVAKEIRRTDKANILTVDDVINTVVALHSILVERDLEETGALQNPKVRNLLGLPADPRQRREMLGLPPNGR